MCVEFVFFKFKITQSNWIGAPPKTMKSWTGFAWAKKKKKSTWIYGGNYVKVDWIRWKSQDSEWDNNWTADADVWDVYRDILESNQCRH